MRIATPGHILLDAKGWVIMQDSNSNKYTGADFLDEPKAELREGSFYLVQETNAAYLCKWKGGRRKALAFLLVPTEEFMAEFTAVEFERQVGPA